MEQDEHIAAMQRWLEKIVMGLNFCPFARPASEAGHVRVVTSTAVTGDGVLEDLCAEALRLPPDTESPSAVPVGRATTTVLCCPYVPEWQDFKSFRHFYEEDLQKGFLFSDAEELGARLYVVSFHPKFSAPSLKEGDTVDLREDEDDSGSAVRGAVVLDPAAGYDEEGQALAKVKLDDGSETYIESPGSDERENTVSCAPRPAFHLLRISDLTAESAQSLVIKERNGRTVADLGASTIEEMVRKCG